MIGGHLTIADRTHITASSVVQSSVTEPGVYSRFLSTGKASGVGKDCSVLVRKLGTMRDRIRELERTVKALTETEK